MDGASNEFKFAIAVCLLWPQIAKNKLGIGFASAS